MLFPSLAPSHPGGTQQVAPSSSTTAGPRTVSGSPPRRSKLRGPGSHRQCGQRRARSAGRGPRSRSAPRAHGGMTPPGRPRAEPSARTTDRGSADRRAPCRGSSPASSKGMTYERTRSWRSSRRRGRAPRGRRQRLGRGPCRCRARRRAHRRAAGPAPPKATNAKSRGSWPRSTETRRSARSISALTTSMTACGSKSPRASSGGRSVELEPAGERAGEAAEHEVGVGDGRLEPAAAVAGRPGIGAGALRADAQRAAAVAPGDRAAACADGLQVDGRQADRKAVELALCGVARPAHRRSGRRRWMCRPCRARSRSRRRPARRCGPRRRRRPRAPRRARATGWRAASASVQTPPEERITSGSASPASRQRSASDHR